MDIDRVEAHIYDYYDDPSLGIVEIEPLWNGNKTIGGAMMSGEGTTPVIPSIKSISPNPFTKKTVIRYSSIVKSKNPHLTLQSLRIYDVSGRLVKRFTIDDSRLMNIVWDGCDKNNHRVATGIYFIRLKSSNFTSTKKVILVR